MKTAAFIIAFALCAAAAYGGTASVVSSFRSPLPYNESSGMDYYNQYLYFVSGASKLYQATTTGSLVRTTTIAPYATGFSLGYPATESWVAARSWIYRIRTYGGGVIESLSIPELWMWGITYGEGWLWVSDYSANPNYVHKVSTQGPIMSSFRIPYHIRGVKYDNGGLWLAARSTPGIIYRVTTGGSVIDSFPSAGIGYPTGVTWDGQYLWHGTEGGVIYRLSVKYTGIAPASLGRVKAIYG